MHGFMEDIEKFDKEVLGLSGFFGMILKMFDK